MKKQLSIRTMTSIAVLSAVAFVLAFFEFPVPLSPSFARMDLSDFPALIGGIIGSVVMGIVAALANYFILLPLFEQFMPLDQVIASFGAFIPFIKTKLDVVLYNAFPFNLLKGLVITGFTMLVYKRIRPLLKGKE
jgi:riboflavin transporter FmnP